jgi:hypothetical protein
MQVKTWQMNLNENNKKKSKNFNFKKDREEMIEKKEKR